MKITDKIHRIRIDFKIGDVNLERFVYMYVLVGKEGIYLIDTGTFGADKTLRNYLEENKECFPNRAVKTIFLTHTHPDHIGGAAEMMKANPGCEIYGSADEQEWVENIDKQFEERSIPNFYDLVSQSVKLTGTIEDDGIFKPENGLTIRIIESKGHSNGSLSFYWEEENALFTGDAIPVAGDIPIYVNMKESFETLEKLKNYPNVNLYLSAWDEIYDSKTGPEKIDAAIRKMKNIENAVREEIKEKDEAETDKAALFKGAAKRLNLEFLIGNPLFIKSVYVTIDEIQNEKQKEKQNNKQNKSGSD